MTDRLLTAKDLAERWRVSTHHVYRLAREGKIPVVNLGRYKRFRLDEIERWELKGQLRDEASRYKDALREL